MRKSTEAKNRVDRGSSDGGGPWEAGAWGWAFLMQGEHLRSWAERPPQPQAVWEGWWAEGFTRGKATGAFLGNEFLTINASPAKYFWTHSICVMKTDPILRLLHNFKKVYAEPYLR